MLIPREKKSFPLTRKLSFPPKLLMQRGGKIIDTIGVSVWAAWGFRLLRAGYTGPLIRVRRSTDNVEQDIGFSAAGDLDETALTAFIGVNSALITTVYDQSNNSRHLAQTSFGSQPPVINAGTYNRISTRACLTTDGISHILATAIAAVPQPVTIASVVELIQMTVNNFIYDAPPTAASRIGAYFAAANSINVFAPTEVLLKSGLVANTKATIVEVYQGASSSQTFNGVTLNGNPGTGNFGGMKIGAHQDNFFYGNHKYGDRIVFAGALTTGQVATLAADFKAYWGTP